MSSFPANERQSVIVHVAVPLPLDAPFSYRVPAPLAPAAAVGRRLLVPFGRRKVTGYVLEVVDDDGRELRDVLEFLDDGPLFTPDELALYRWASSYYLHPLGEVIKAALPAGINVQSRRGRGLEGDELTGGRSVKTERVYRAVAGVPETAPPPGKASVLLAHLTERGQESAPELRRLFGECSVQLRRLRELGFVEMAEREIYRDPFRTETFGHDCPLVLNERQTAALVRLRAALDAGRFTPFLLRGVTGSGKTEVYLQAIAHCLEQGRSALVLVPEIALTPQLVSRFRRRFRCGVAVLHSGLSDGERFDEWRRIRRGEAAIVIGARSAIFAPLADLGMIVVDEEHEGSYKQGEGFRYNARDMALVRGKMAGACVVLGTATPQVTTWHAVAGGKLECLDLPERVNGLPLPSAEIIDVRGARGHILHPRLAAEVEANLARGEQTLLFLNRRGFSTWLTCEECGHVLRCPNCQVTLTYHQGRNRHICHYCDYAVPAPSMCPGCGCGRIIHLGLGTEQVEAYVREHFPHARVDRMDRDTTARRGGHARILRKVAERQTDILIGTQMVAKGHDFPGITLVGILSVESTLNIPDYRSAERTFQLVTQLIGRAGRGDDPGRVLIQSLNPDHYALAHAVAGDMDGFYGAELAFRHETGYPPFAHLAALCLSGTAASAVERTSELLAARLRELRRDGGGRVEILGPAPAPLAKLRGRFRRQILLKAAGRTALHRLVCRIRESFQPPAGVRLLVDIDPVDLM
ncbi:primosomal protein N' [Geobacter sulfurreducens]|uniref:replication restart helicase PriA n=1 Tax=Geobacter sulfurreducens TaxID=35554 RepID=UPI000DBB6269|nr:primosomal protein N' [Geobacter sulfurreducens]BBA68678.1 Primosomal protein N' [Geobacter sulfurreducens]